jgi:hypothetical protein
MLALPKKAPLLHHIYIMIGNWVIPAAPGSCV